MSKKYSSVFLLTKRNLKFFFSQKMAVFGSALAPLIVLLLFVLFLKNSQISALKAAVGEDFDEKALNNFVNAWLISGVMSTAMITVPLGACTCLCNDNEKNIGVMFSISPVKPYKIAISYFIMVYLISTAIVMLLFFIGLAYICGTAGAWIGTANFFYTIATMLVQLLGATLGTVFVVSFIKTQSLFQVANIIIGSTCGFIIGAYIPVSQFPLSIQTFCNLFPASSSTTLIKTFLVTDFLDTFAGHDPEIINKLKEYYSFNMEFAGKQINQTAQWVYIGLFPLLMIPINVWRFTYLSKSKA